MIPTMIVFGLVLGHWWRTTLIAAALVWPVILLGGGMPEGTPAEQLGVLAAGGLLGVANAAVGVAAHQAVRLAVLGAFIAVRTGRRRNSRGTTPP